MPKGGLHGNKHMAGGVATDPWVVSVHFVTSQSADLHDFPIHEEFNSYK